MNPIIEREDAYSTGVYSKRPVVMVRGSGALLWDDEEREYIDCTAGYGIANIGHARTEIAATLAQQAQRLITCPEIVYNDVRATLLERLAGLTPEGLNSIFLCNSGTEAIEGALKFARLATGRSGIIATLRSFHGRTMGALSATWEPHYREPFAPLVPDVRHVRYNDLAAMQEAINEQTAAVIIELVQGEGGVHVASEEYVHGLAILCRERGVLLIVDEVQTGFGRTGQLFACHHYNLQPDILCLAKSLGGGIPMGAICLGPQVMESGRISKGVHGSSFGGNPLACAAALTTLDILEREALPQRATLLGQQALEQLRALSQHTSLIREVRGRGLLIGIELRKRVQPYLETLLEHGVLALQAGPNVIRLLPPLVITEEQLQRVIDVVSEVLVGAQFIAPSLTTSTNTPVGAQFIAPSSPIGNHPAYLNGEGAMNCAPTQASRHIASANGESRREGAIHCAPTEADRHVTAVNGESANGEGAMNCAPTESPEVELLMRMLTIPSYSGQEGALASYLMEQARQRGLTAYVDEVGNFVASTPLAEGTSAHQPPLVLLGHMDTVRGVIPVRLEDGLLYGRGAVDAKGPLAAFLCAAARLARTGELERPIVVIGAVEEEAATSRGARAVVGRYQPSACIIGEPSGSQAVTIGYKGRLLVDYELRYPLRHTAGPERSSSEVAVTFWERVRAHAEAWNLGRHGEGDRHGEQRSHFTALTPSLRGMSSAQDGLEEWTKLTIGYRLPPDYDIATLRSQLQEWACEDGATIRFTGEERAFQTSRTTPLARAFIRAIRAAGGQPTFKHKTGTSDMNVVGLVWGENIVAYGPGDSRLDHTPQEHIRIAEYLQAIDVLESVLRVLTLQRERVL